MPIDQFQSVSLLSSIDFPIIGFIDCTGPDLRLTVTAHIIVIAYYSRTSIIRISPLSGLASLIPVIHDC